MRSLIVSPDGTTHSDPADLHGPIARKILAARGIDWHGSPHGAVYRLMAEGYIRVGRERGTHALMLEGTVAALDNDRVAEVLKHLAVPVDLVILDVLSFGPSDYSLVGCATVPADDFIRHIGMTSALLRKYERPPTASGPEPGPQDYERLAHHLHSGSPTRVPGSELSQCQTANVPLGQFTIEYLIESGRFPTWLYMVGARRLLECALGKLLAYEQSKFPPEVAEERASLLRPVAEQVFAFIDDTVRAQRVSMDTLSRLSQVALHARTLLPTPPGLASHAYYPSNYLSVTRTMGDMGLSFLTAIGYLLDLARQKPGTGRRAYIAGEFFTAAGRIVAHTTLPPQVEARYLVADPRELAYPQGQAARDWHIIRVAQQRSRGLVRGIFLAAYPVELQHLIRGYPSYEQRTRERERQRGRRQRRRETLGAPPVWPPAASADNWDGRFSLWCGEDEPLAVFDSALGAGAAFDTRRGHGPDIDQTAARMHGFGVLMKPATFLKLAYPLVTPRPDSPDYLLATRHDPGWGQPVLHVSDDLSLIRGHDGRHRSGLVHAKCPDALMVVHVRMHTLPARRITQAMIAHFRAGVWAERSGPDAEFVKGPLFDTAFLHNRTLTFRPKARRSTRTVQGPDATPARLTDSVPQHVLWRPSLQRSGPNDPVEGPLHARLVRSVLPDIDKALWKYGQTGLNDYLGNIKRAIEHGEPAGPVWLFGIASDLTFPPRRTADQPFHSVSVKIRGIGLPATGRWQSVNMEINYTRPDRVDEEWQPLAPDDPWTKALLRSIGSFDFTTSTFTVSTDRMADSSEDPPAAHQWGEWYDKLFHDRDERRRWLWHITYPNQLPEIRDSGKLHAYRGFSRLTACPDQMTANTFNASRFIRVPVEDVPGAIPVRYNERFVREHPEIAETISEYLWDIDRSKLGDPEYVRKVASEIARYSAECEVVVPGDFVLPPSTEWGIPAVGVMGRLRAPGNPAP